MASPSYSTVAEIFNERIQYEPDKVIYTFLDEVNGEERPLSNRELGAGGKQILGRIYSDGTPANNLVLIVLPSGLLYVKALFACMSSGLVAIPLYPPGKRGPNLETFMAVLKHTRAATILTTERIKKGLEDKGLCDWGIRILALDIESDQFVTSSGLPSVEVKPDDLALLQFTSGSTGTPKGVKISHANMLSNFEVIRKNFGHDKNSRGVVWLPPYHDMGLIGGIMQPFYTNFPVVLMGSVYFIQQPLRWLQAISHYQATSSGGPNFAYDLCAERIKEEDKKNLDLSSWRVAFNGAEPVRKQTIDRFYEAFKDCGFKKESFYPCFGMAEATLYVSGGHYADDLVRNEDMVSCGKVADECEVQILNPETFEPVEEGETGVIFIHGEGVTSGYYKDEEKTEKAFRSLDDGKRFFNTGDMGCLSDGDLYINGRIKDMIIIRGKNYFPEDIEHAIRESSDLLSNNKVVAFSVDQEHQEELAVVIELKRTQLKTDRLPELTDLIKGVVATQFQVQLYALDFYMPRMVPVTSSGKIKRYATREIFAQGGIDPVYSWRRPVVDTEEELIIADFSEGEGDEMRKKVKATLKAIIKRETGVSIEANGEDSPLSSYGLDSVQLVVIIHELETVLGIRLPQNFLENYDSFNKMTDFLARLVSFRELSSSFSEAELDFCLDQLAGANSIEEEEKQEVLLTPDLQDFKEWPEIAELEQRQRELASMGIPNPYFTLHEGINSDTTSIDGRTYVNFSSNNYLGVCEDPAVLSGINQAINTYGSSVSASRIITGERPLHLELEREIADFFGKEAALTFVGGNTANVSTVGHLFGKDDLILYDELAHNSLLQGAELAGAATRPFKHNDFREADQILEKVRHNYKRVLLFTEGIFSMDGDIAPLHEFVLLKHKHKALLMVDECLSAGILGKTGRGICEYHGVDPKEVDILMGGLSKAFGSCGGFIAGDAALINYLKYTTPGFIYTTGMTPANAAAALASVRLLRKEPQRLNKLYDNVSYFIGLLKENGFKIGLSKDTPVVPVHIGDETVCLQLYAGLNQAGINVQPIVYPGVPLNSARLRFFVSAQHKKDQLDLTVSTMAALYRQITESMMVAVP